MSMCALARSCNIQRRGVQCTRDSEKEKNGRQEQNIEEKKRTKTKLKNQEITISLNMLNSLNDTIAHSGNKQLECIKPLSGLGIDERTTTTT